MTTPQITIAGSVADLFGAAQAGTLVVQLCGCDVFATQIPRVPSGPKLIGMIAPLPIACTGGSYSFMLWGNDVILPLNTDGSPATFYTVKVVDSSGNTVQMNAYQFTGTQTVDLATATPYVPPAPVPPVPGTVGFVDDAALTPAITNDNNPTFELPSAPNPPSSLDLFKGAGRLTAGIGYSLAGLTVTYNAGYIPQPGDSQIANYRIVVPNNPSTTLKFWNDVVPSGAIDGVNNTFTIAPAPNPAASLNLFLNTGRLTAGIGYTLTGGTIVYANGYVPQVGDSHICNYRTLS
jgi:hypothetical protein